MNHSEGERRVKILQKDFLLWIEDTPALSNISPEEFNKLRRKVFRGTFQAFRLGIIGIEPEYDGLLPLFTDWLEDIRLDENYVWEVTNKCFMTALTAFSIGTFVRAYKEAESEVQYR